MSKDFLKDKTTYHFIWLLQGTEKRQEVAERQAFSYSATFSWGWEAADLSGTPPYEKQLQFKCGKAKFSLVGN